MGRLQKQCLILLVCLAWGVSGAAWATPPIDLGDNAALRYWEATAIGHTSLSAQDRQNLRALLDQSPPGKTAFGPVAEEAQMRLLRQGAPLPCAWGLDYQGPFTLLPHLGTLTELSELASCHVLMDFEQKPGGGPQDVEDIAAIFALGRHIASDRYALTTVIGCRIETQIAGVAAKELHRMDHAQLKALAGRLGSLPVRPSLPDLIRSDYGQCLDWTVNRFRQIEATHPTDNALAMQEALTMLQPFDQSANHDGAPRIRDLWKASGGTTAGLIRLGEVLRPFYVELANLASLPPAEMHSTEEALRKKFGADNPLLELLTPFPLFYAREADMRAKTCTALLQAGVAYRLGDTDTFDKVADPLGQGPFAKPTPRPDGGFEIRSTGLLSDAKPIALIFANEPYQPAQPTTQPTQSPWTAEKALRQIHQGAVIWSQNQGKQLPPDLETLVRGDFISVATLIASTSAAKVPADYAFWPTEKQSAWLRANTSFAYIPGRSDDGDGRKVVAFEKLQASDAKLLHIVFNDDHVKRVPIDEARRLIQEQTGKTLEAWSQAK